MKRLLPKLAIENPRGIETFVDPDIQYSLRAAQLTYARSGDPDVADVLVDLLVDRTRAVERNILQISLTEALEVAAKLTPDQYAALSLIWLMRYTMNSGITNRESLRSYITKNIAPLVPSIKTGIATFQHLEYAGCGNLGVSAVTLEQVFRSNYSGLFCKGFTEDQLSSAFGETIPSEVRSLVIPCLNDSQLLQINMLNENDFKAKADVLGLDDIVRQKLRSLNGVLFNDDELRSYLIESHEIMDTLFEMWSNSGLRQMTLTTVGVTIAHANCRRILGESPADLSIWINSD